MIVLHPVLGCVLDYVKQKDFDGLEAYLHNEFDMRELTVIKCESCGEIVAVSPMREWLPLAFRGGDSLVEYLVLKHLKTHRDHQIIMPIGPIRHSLSDMFLGALRRTAEIHGMTEEEAFMKRLPYLEAKL